MDVISNFAYISNQNEYVCPEIYNLGENNGVKFIDSVMLRTPMILHPKSNKREWAFEQVYENPLDTFKGDSDEFFCFPAKVGDLTVFVYFHRDFMSNGVSLANLFEPDRASSTGSGPRNGPAV